MLRHNLAKRVYLSWRWHIDMPLLIALLLVAGYGLVILYSASGDREHLIQRQFVHHALGFAVMLAVAQIPPRWWQQWAIWFYAGALGLLGVVLLFGDVGKGAQRWLEFGFLRFQPSELVKLAVPCMLAWYLAEHSIPPRGRHILYALVLIALPALLIAKQPDLGTALLVVASGFAVLLFAGLAWRWIAGVVGLIAVLAPLVWFFAMHDYQRRRVLTFLNPEHDPLGSGYHIIQSKIAIGSGGIYGKGWMQGTQSQLEFLPERFTDFIAAVIGEELGLLGLLLLLSLYAFIIGRCLYIGYYANDTYARLLAGALTLTFFVYIFVNMSMVMGLLPVVGVPLPLVSYGGTSLLTLMVGFGMMMSIHTHRRLLG